MGSRVWERLEPRLKEQVPMEGYRTDISSNIAVSHTSPAFSAQAPQCSTSPVTGQRQPLGDNPLPALTALSVSGNLGTPERAGGCSRFKARRRM